MTSVFSRIIGGELPARHLHADDSCVAFLTVAPITSGHALVVPRAEVDHWTDLDPDTAAHLMTVAQRIGQAQRTAFAAPRAALVIAGFEVPHAHLHVLPTWDMADLDFQRADPSVDAAALDAAHARLLAALAAHPAAPVSGT